MNFFAQKEVKKLLKNKGIKPKKQLGQNFLIEKNIVEKIITAADVKGNDIVLEVGAGIGVLTQSLAKKAKKVIAIEKDKKMASLLKEGLGGLKNIKIVSADALKINPKDLIGANRYKLVANIPYYITAPFIDKFLKSSLKPKTMVLMLQKEVAQRICSDPPKMNRLAVLVKFYSTPKIICFVRKESFWPSPKVDSAIIKMDLNDNSRDKMEIGYKKTFFEIVKIGFSHPRKKLINNFIEKFGIPRKELIKLFLANQISINQRAENLSLNSWINLTKEFIKKGIK